MPPRVDPLAEWSEDQRRLHIPRRDQKAPRTPPLAGPPSAASAAEHDRLTRRIRPVTGPCGQAPLKGRAVRHAALRAAHVHTRTYAVIHVSNSDFGAKRPAARIGGPHLSQNAPFNPLTERFYLYLRPLISKCSSIFWQRYFHFERINLFNDKERCTGRCHVSDIDQLAHHMPIER